MLPFPKKNCTIFPKVGFGEIKFGMYRRDIKQIIGSPDKAVIDKDGDALYIYESLGIVYLCFEKEERYKLTNIELDMKSNASLWGVELFKLTFDEIKDICRKNNFYLEYVDKELPQKMFQIKQLAMDFYFDKNGIIEEVSYGVFVDKLNYIKWPIKKA